MHISLEVSDELIPALTPGGLDPARAALEAMALEAYRARRLTGYRLRVLPRLGSRYELGVLLKQHRIEAYSAAAFEQELVNVRAQPESDAAHAG